MIRGWCYGSLVNSPGILCTQSRSSHENSFIKLPKFLSNVHKMVCHFDDMLYYYWRCDVPLKSIDDNYQKATECLLTHVVSIGIRLMVWRYDYWLLGQFGAREVLPVLPLHTGFRCNNIAIFILIWSWANGWALIPFASWFLKISVPVPNLIATAEYYLRRERLRSQLSISFISGEYYQANWLISAYFPPARYARCRFLRMRYWWW